MNRGNNLLFFTQLIFLSGCGASKPAPDHATFFIPIPFSKFSAIRAPCLDVQIEGQTFCLELDLGFQGELTIDPEPLNYLSKTFLHCATLHGMHGKQYQTDLYRISEAQMGPLLFTCPILQSNSHQFTHDSVFVKNKKPSFQEVGRIGWKLFQNTSVLVDIARETLIICDSLPTLKLHGYDIKNFSKTKLYTDRGLLEFEAHTDSGPLLCTLDTGSSWNVINTDTHTSIQEALWDPENARIAPTFYLYRNNLKNRFLTAPDPQRRSVFGGPWAASAFPQNFRSHLRLAYRQWSLAPNENFAEPPCQIPDSSGCFGIYRDRLSCVNLGPIFFHALPIQMPIPIKAILGMEFFRDHLVFIDFLGEEIYISKILPEGES